MIRNPIGKLAIVLIVAGALAMAGPTFGFSSIAADRGVEVSTADDPNAFLGVVDNSGSADADIGNSNDESLLFYLDDNAGEFPSATDISADVVAFDGSSTGLEATVQTDDGSNDYVVVVTCGSSDLNTQGTPTVEIVADGGVHVELQRTTGNAIDVNCRGGGNGGGTGPASFEADDVDADGPTQRFRFDVGALGNKESASIDLSDAQENAGVDYTDASATIVSGQDARRFGFDDSTYEITYQAQGNVGGTLEIELSGFEITGDQGGTVYYSDDQGRSDSDTFAVPAVVSDGGDVSTDGDAVVEDGGTASEIDAGGNVEVGENANVNDDVTAGGDVTFESGSTANAIDADGAMTIGSDVSVNDDITAIDSVEIGDGSTVNDIDTEGDVTLDESVSANGEIDGDEITIGQYSTVDDDITATGDVHVEDGATINDIDSDGTVYIGCNVNENGEIDAEEVVYECE